MSPNCLGYFEGLDVLKLNSVNTITISRLPTPYEQSLIDSADMDLVAEMIAFNAPKTYTKEEVESLIFKYADEEWGAHSSKEDTKAYNEWIELNL